MSLSWVRPLLPDAVISVLRAAKWKRSTSRFKTRVVRHEYVDISLQVSISDPIGQEWYDKNCPDLEELRTLVGFVDTGRAGLTFVLGAHQCVVSLVLARALGEAGKVVALEGARFNVDVGRKNIELNKADNVVLVHAVLGAADGNAEFVAVGNGYIGRGKKEVTERVRAVSVDTLAQEFGDPDFIFMDIEGVEYSALRDCDLVRRCKTVWAVEVHGDDDMAHYGGSNGELVALFRRMNYDIYEFSRDGRYLKLDDDAVVTRSRTHLCCKPNVGAGGAARTDGSAGP